MPSRASMHLREITTQQNSAIGLYRDHLNGVVGARAGRERWINHARLCKNQVRTS